jgi:release factor glutamine methyltransferase
VRAKLEEESETRYWRLDTESGVFDASIQQIIQEATARLRPITDTPRLEAEVLLSHVLDVSRTRLLTYPEHLLTTDQLSHYQARIHRRASDYPLPYLTGRAEFYGLELEVTPEVMIPRPETETLVGLALARRPSTVVDVGTGSGCIAIALAANLPDVAIYAIEISPPALAVARRNVERHGLGARVRLMGGNVLTPRPSPVDLIVSNPPYVSTNEWITLPLSVRNHEPRLALDGGSDGLTVIQQLLIQAPAVLRPGGALLIEIGAEQGETVSRLARTFFPRAAVCLHPDLAGRDRVLEIQT